MRPWAHAGLSRARMLGVAVGVLCGGVVVLPGVALAAGGPTNNTPPAIQSMSFTGGPPEVGQQLECSQGTWSPAGDDISYTFAWYRDSNSGTPISTSSYYTPASGDVGHVLICQVTATDYTTQASSATDDSQPTAAVAPEPSVEMTEYSPDISGSLGEAVAGATVTATLDRGGTAVASTSATTDASGDWSSTLAPSPGFGGTPVAVTGVDTLSVSYSPPPGQSATMPDAALYEAGSYPGFYSYGSSSIASNGASIGSTSDQGCGSNTFNGTLSFIVDGVQHSTTQQGAGCVYQPTTPLTDQDTVLAELSGDPVSDPNSGSVSLLTAVSPVGLLGTSDGPPTCTGDLVSGQITCGNLDGGDFTVALNGGSPVALTPVQGDGSSSGSTAAAVVPGLAAGDTVTLRESSPAPEGGNRVLSTLHLATLRVRSSPTGASLTCQPGEEIPFDQTCPASGVLTSQNAPGLFEESDPLSGGATIINLPGMTVLPTDNESVPGSFTAYANLYGIGSPAQVTGEVSSVALTIISGADGSTVFSQTMTPTSDSVGPYVDANVSNLANGRYVAKWALTDSNGDTSELDSDFVVESGSTGPTGPPGSPGPQGPPGATGAQGPQGATGAQGSAGPQGAGGVTGAQGPAGPEGPTGPRGPAGPRGPVGRIQCVLRRTHAHSRTRTERLCRVVVSSPGSSVVSVEITRGRRTYALGTTLVRRGVAHLELRQIRKITRAKYRVTIVATRGKTSRVTRSTIRIV